MWARRFFKISTGLQGNLYCLFWWGAKVPFTKCFHVLSWTFRVFQSAHFITIGYWPVPASQKSWQCIRFICFRFYVRSFLCRPLARNWKIATFEPFLPASECFAGNCAVLMNILMDDLRAAWETAGWKRIRQLHDLTSAFGWTTNFSHSKLLWLIGLNVWFSFCDFVERNVKSRDKRWSF